MIKVKSKNKGLDLILEVLSVLEESRLSDTLKSLNTAAKYLKDNIFKDTLSSEEVGGGYSNLKLKEDKLNYFINNRIGGDRVDSHYGLTNDLASSKLEMYKLLLITYVKHSFIDQKVIETVQLIEPELTKMLLMVFKSDNESWDRTLSGLTDFICKFSNEYKDTDKSLSFMKHLWKYIDSRDADEYINLIKPHLEEKFPINQIDIKVSEVTINSEIDDRALKILLESPKGVERVSFDDLKYVTPENLKIVNEFLKLRKDIWMNMYYPENFKYLTNLENISFTEFTEECIHVLSSIKVVKRLRLGTVKYKDLTSLLKYNDTLIELGFEGDISRESEDVISKLSKLEIFSTSSSKFRSFGFLKSLNITDLYIYGSRTKEYNDLKNLKQLKRFHLKTNKNWEDFNFIEGLENIEEIEIDYCSAIKRFPKCNHLKKLKRVSLMQCNKLIDVSELQELKNCFVFASGKELSKAGINISSNVDKEKKQFDNLLDATKRELYGGRDKISREEHLEIVQKLIEDGADVNIVDELGNTPLLRSMSDKCHEIAKLLILNGADTNIRDINDGSTPLMKAVKSDSWKNVELLIKSGVNVNTINKKGMTALMNAFYYITLGDPFKSVELLIKAGADIEIKDNECDLTALDLAAERNKTESVTLLFKAGADFNRINKNSGRTPLLSACYNRNFEMMKLFVDKGANVNHRDKDGYTPLIALVGKCKDKKEKMKCVNYLINAGADVNAVSDEFETAIASEADGGDPKVVSLLIEKGADINIRNTRSGNTPLLRASGSRSDKNVEILLEAGADVSVKEIYGNTALGQALLFGAQTKKLINVVNMLINHGVDINSVNKNGETALDIALSKKGKYSEVVEILKKAGAVCRG